MIWITGAQGLLGQNLVEVFEDHGLSVLATGGEVDIGDWERVKSFAQEENLASHVRWIINCAAYTNVEKAEEDPAACWKTNSEGPAHLVCLARQAQARLVQISTDYVFSGKALAMGRCPNPYTEGDRPEPLSVYGASKLQGEKAVLTIPGGMVLRTAWLFGPRGKSFVDTLLEKMKTQPVVDVVSDQQGCPTYSEDLCQTLLKIVQEKHPMSGIWHFANSGSCTRFDLAQEILRQGQSLGLVGHRVEIRPVPSDFFPTKAPRPPWSVLSTQKIANRLNLKIRPWQEALGAYLQKKVSGGSPPVRAEN